MILKHFTYKKHDNQYTIVNAGKFNKRIWQLSECQSAKKSIKQKTQNIKYLKIIFHHLI